MDGPWRAGRTYPEVEAPVGLVATHLGSRFRGAVVGFEQGAVVLRSPNSGLERIFTLYPGSFSVGGETVTLVRPPARQVPPGPARTASGSLAVAGAGARVARPSRLLVEGIHDAELVEKVWGDDLRIEGVVVEYLEGIDDLVEIVNRFQPGPGRRLGVLVDHLVEGSKESKIAALVSNRYLRVVGHPYIDIWEAVKPSSVSIKAWPRIPHGQDWKKGVLQTFGWPATDQADVAAAWKHILSKVKSFADLDPALLGRVEELIDFVTLD
jgi:hypothetical protein